MSNGVKENDMRDFLKIVLFFGILLLLILVVKEVVCTSTIRVQGTINYKEVKGTAEIAFSPFDLDSPPNLESNDEFLVSYAKIHHGEKIECDVLRRIEMGGIRYSLKKVYYE